MLVMWQCDWPAKGDVLHLVFPDVHCLKMPHMINMAISGVAAIVTIVFAMCMVGIRNNPAVWECA